ncbi:MAG: glycosyltransferase family 39 protein [Elusimicrobiota bacterium]|jgi:hypothetical protein
MKKTSTLALIIGWSLLVHWPGITSPLLDYHAHRQCQTASMARNYFRHGMHFLKPEVDTNGPAVWTGTEFPLYSYGVAMLYKLFGFHEILGRLLSIALTAWSAVFLYGLVRRRLGETVGLWSALIMCAIPVHIYFTRTVQPESMALWAFLGFVYYLDRRLAGEGRLWDWPVLIALGALGPLLKLPFLYLVGGLWLILGIEYRRIFHPGYWGALIAIIGLTAAWYHYARQAPVQVLPLGAGEHWQNLKVLLQPDFWQAKFISRFPEIDTTYSGLLLGAIGVRSLWRSADQKQSRDNRLFFTGWWLITAAYIVLLGAYGWTHKYTDIPWAPINSIFIALGVLTAWRWATSSGGRRALVILLILGIPVHAALRIKHWYRLERLWLYPAHDLLQRISHPGDLVLTNTRETPVLLYYIDRCGYCVNLDTASQVEVDQWLPKVRFFLTPVEGSWTRHPEWAAFFEKRARRIRSDPEYCLYEVRPPLS